MSVKSNFEERWSKFIEKRAHRLRTSEKAASESYPSVYLTALKEKADRLGASVSEVKDIHDHQPRPYPTQDCILPTELADFMNGEEMAIESIEHLANCPPCCALLDMAAPSEDRLRALLEEVRIRVGEVAVRSDAVLTQLFDVPA